MKTEALVFVFLAGGIATPVARAQQQDSGEPALAEESEQRAETDDAERLYARAVRAKEKGRWAEARDLLRRSLALRRDVRTAFNLAVALERTGQVVEATEMLTTVLAGRWGSPPEALRAKWSAALERWKSQVARLRLEVSGATSYHVRLDGESLSKGVGQPMDSVLLLDPGPHVLQVSAADRVSAERRIHATRGMRRTLALRLEPRANPRDDDDRHRRRRRRWIVAATVVLLAAGGAATAIALRVRRTDPTSPGFLGSASTLTSWR